MKNREVDQTLGSGSAGLAEEPYLLRGHHLGTLTWLASPMNSTPEDLALGARDTYTVARGNQTAETVDFNILAHPQLDPGAYSQAYAVDLIGSTEEQAASYERSLTKVVREFTQLHDNHPIELIAGGKDAICGACTFQKHCDTEPPANEDAAMLAVFEDVTKHYAEDGAPDLSARTEKGSILTDARTVRQFMGYFAVTGALHRLSYNDAMDRVVKYGEVFGGPDEPDFARRLKMLES